MLGKIYRSVLSDITQTLQVKVHFHQSNYNTIQVVTK